MNLESLLTSDKLKTSLGSIREAARVILEAPRLTHFTDHSINHSECVIGNIELLLDGSPLSKPLSEHEAFILLASAYLHDIGMQSAYHAGLPEKDDYSMEEKNIIRDKHHESSAKMIEDSINPRIEKKIPLGLDGCKDYVKYISLVTKSHRRGKPSISSVDLKDGYMPLSEKIRIRLLVALLRLGDELHRDYQRVKMDRIKIWPIPVSSKFYWWTNHYTKSVDIENGKIRVIFRLPENHGKDPVIEVFIKKTGVSIKEQLEEVKDILWDHGCKLQFAHHDAERDIEVENEGVLEPVPDDLRKHIEEAILKLEMTAGESGAAGGPVYLIDGIPYSDNFKLVESIGKITRLFFRSKYHEALNEIKRAQLMVMTPSQKMALYLSEGGCKYHLGRQEDAEKDLNEILKIAARIRQKTGGETPDEDIRGLEAATLNNIGIIYKERGELDKALKYHEDALNIARSIGYVESEAGVLGNIGIIYKDRGEPDKALKYHEDALNIARSIGYRESEAIDLGNIGIIFQNKGELDKALGHHEEALKINREIGYRQGEASDLGNIGLIYQAKGELDEALIYLEEALKINREIGYRQGEAGTLGNISLIYRDRGKPDEALRYFEEALKINREIGYRQGEANQLGNIGIIYQDRKEVDKALEYYEEALKIDREIGYRQGEATDLGNIGLIYRDRGKLDKALKCHEDALKIDMKIGYRQGEATDLGNIGLIYRDRGEVDKALEYHEEALKIDREIGYRQGEATDLGNIGVIYRDRGEADEALEYLQKAGLIFNEIGAIHLSIQVLENIVSVHIKEGEPEKVFEYLFWIFSKVSSPEQFFNIVECTLAFVRFLASSENWEALSKIDSLYNTGNIQDEELISVFKAVREYALYKISGDGARLENFQKIRGELSKETRELLDSAIEPD